MRMFSAPTTINLEITEACNTKCRHCYNFWRHDDGRGVTLTKERLDRLIDEFIDCGVFHVILSGGEPFTRFELLEHGLKRLVDNNISISCNSNLMLANEERLKRLRDVGLDHILTSLNSFDEATNDFMVNQKGAFRLILRGIDLAVSAGIRISANMIIGKPNFRHVYQTGKLAADLGCQRLFGTRVVPSVTLKQVHGTDFDMDKGLGPLCPGGNGASKAGYGHHDRHSGELPALSFG